MSAPRILLVDNHPALRRGVQEILADYLPDAEFGQAGDAQQAVEQVRSQPWNLAILGLNLPGRGGIEAIRGLKEAQPGVAILVYSAHAEEHFGLRAVRAGADGYLTKDRPSEKLGEAVTVILNGGRYVSADLASALMNNLKGSPQNRYQLLSDREIQVLRRLAAGRTPSEIGRELSLSAKTISTYRARILEKLELRTNADLVRYAIENGVTG
ncbi:MAG TPA: response regulator transcription factor [Verrucomicrobiae bacterium]|nr:response regulator transcription factor [Verrucomicrobiae bacterium]